MAARKKAAARAPKASRSKKVAGKSSESLSPRVTRRELRRERSREEIIVAAQRVLLRSGVAATTLDAVAEEVGLTKAALYYYYPSKDALLFEVVFRIVEAQSHAVHDAVREAESGSASLRAIVRETVERFAPRMDDFRLAYLAAQLGASGAVHVAASQLERVRPLNDLAFAGAAKRLTEEWQHRPGRARVDPRLMAFLANLAALGILTMKGMVESIGDPLLYSDAELIEGFARIFEAAAKP